MAQEDLRQSRETSVSDDTKLETGQTDFKSSSVAVEPSTRYNKTDAVNTLLQYQSSVAEGEPRQVTLAFENLSVSASSDLEAPVKTLPRAILNTFGPDQYSFIKSKLPAVSQKQQHGHTSKPILRDFTGLVNAGELLYVMGRPGSGCSSFLRAAANRSQLPVSGDLTYRNVAATDFARLYQRETVYLPEEDQHIASLTVRQTIEFALRTSLPPKSRTKALVREVGEAIAELFGLSHVLETPVGGAFSPGVSGGERKRVSIAEIFATGSSVQCYDNSTRGLDSSTALDFVKALRALANIGQKTILATLYQVSDDIYDEFDKVLLIEDGQEIYFGPTTAARAYFEALGFTVGPGLTTVEALLAFLDPTQRSCAKGSPAESIQSTADLVNAFRNSSIFKQLERDIEDGRRTPATSIDIATSGSDLSYVGQTIECLRRESLLAWQQRRVYYVKWSTTIILCLTCGSVYFDISNTAQGAFTRGGILFFALIFNGWLQFPELFDAHTNRSVIQRQARLHLYRPSSVAIARSLIDLPLIAFQHIVFILPFYFLTRLQVDAGKLFFFYLTLFVSTVSFSNLLRMYAYYVQTLDDCFRYGGFSCTVLLLFAGFLIPARDMKPYFGWLHYINPMYYAFENLFSSEFDGLTIFCDDGNFIPNIANAVSTSRICTVPGSTPERNFVDGIDYVAAYGLSYSHRWRNIGIMIAIAVTYLLIGIVGSELFSFGSAGGSFLFFTSKGGKNSASTAEKDLEKSAAILKESALHSEQQEIALSWNKLVAHIGDKQVLKGISGFSRRGQLTALCGVSGAGKSTLLSALSQTLQVGTVSGEVLFGNEAPRQNSRKALGFAQQFDLHDGTATVREALEFSALLRQPKIYTRAEKLQYVDLVLDTLDLRRYEHCLIGDDSFGLDMEYKKRLTIAIEIVARPDILFADEPTSGVDSQGALHIVSQLERLAHRGQAITMTIHQPSALLLSKFDQLLLLSSDGRQVYFGPAKQASAYFSERGAQCPAERNVLEFILETIGAGTNASQSEKGLDWADLWEKSSEAERLQAEISKSEPVENSSVVHEGDTSEFNSSLFEQTWLLTLRILRNQWRNTPYIYSKLWVHTLSAILVGFTFYRVGTSPSDLRNRGFSVYFIVFLVNAIVNVILARYFFATLYWQLREGPSKTYSWVALVNASVLAEMPATLLVTVIYFLPWYFTSGLPQSEAGYMFLFLLTYEIFQVLLGLFMMALSPDLGFAGNMLVFIVCTCNWFNGYIVPYDQMQVFWRSWLYYLSPFTYLLGGMLQAAIGSVPVTCNARDLFHFDPPSDTTCGQYAASWAASASAQLLNPEAIDGCSVCQYTTGDQFLATFNLGSNGLLSGNKWSFWGIFVVFTFTNLLLLYFFTWATKVKHWKLFYFF